MKTSKTRSARPSARTSGDIVALLHKNRHALDKFTVKRIGLFGSYAAGKQTPKSDVDLVIDFEEPTFDHFMGVVDYLEKLLGKKVNVLTPQGIESIRVRRVAENIKSSVVYV